MEIRHHNSVASYKLQAASYEPTIKPLKLLNFLNP